MVRVEWFSESETNIMNKTAAFCSQIDTDKRVKLALVRVREVYREPGFAAWSSEYLRSRRRGVGPTQAAWASILPEVSERGINPGYDPKYQAEAAAKSASLAAWILAQVRSASEYERQFAERDLRSALEAAEWAIKTVQCLQASQ